MARKPSRSGRPQGGCPWAQDDDSNQFSRGPPTSGGGHGGNGGLPVAAPPRTAYKPQANAGAPWASDDQPVWSKPQNSYGAGLNVNPPSGADGYQGHDHHSYAEPLPDDDYDYGYGQPPPSMPMGRTPQARGGGGAPWAVDDAEPMMSVAQSAYRGNNASRGGSAAPVRGGPTFSAKEMKAKMQGAGNLLSWN